jgi:hypothetical protein
LYKTKIIFILFVSVWFSAGCGKKGNSPESSLLHFREFLNNLPQTDLYSVTKALDYYKQNFVSVAPEFRDSAFTDFRALYYNVINGYSEIFWNDSDLVKKVSEKQNDDVRVKDLKNALDKNGLRLSITEGSYYIDEKPDFLIASFKGYVSHAVIDYLQIRSKELTEGFSEDAALLISFKAVGDRIVTWENYLNKYPSSPLLAEAKFSFHLYLNTFLTGLDNSPVTTDGVLRPEIQSIYSDFILKNKNSESGKIVGEFDSLLEKNNFRLPPDIDDFFSENQIELMNGAQPPTR